MTTSSTLDSMQLSIAFGPTPKQFNSYKPDVIAPHQDPMIPTLNYYFPANQNVAYTLIRGKGVTNLILHYTRTQKRAFAHTQTYTSDRYILTTHINFSV